MIEAWPDKYLNLLSDGSIRYEIRRGIDPEDKPVYQKVYDEACQKFAGFSEFNNLSGKEKDQALRTSWQWVDDELRRNGGDWHDHGTGFRLDRPVLNSMLTLQGEILPPKKSDKDQTILESF